MDTEFVNAYLQKQKDMINDLMAKVIMTETRASVAENKLALVSDQNSIIESLNQQIVEKDDNLKKLQSIVNDLSIQKEKLKKELNDIRSSVKQITG
jgi:uncharacterized coiled-coil protein SlyX